MTNKLSERIKNLPVSATLAMAAKARELKENGIDIIGLSLGEPDFNTPDFIKNAAVKAIEDNYNSYTPVDGYLDLKKSICKKFKRDNGLNYNANQIVVSTGAKQSIANTIQVLINPGDDVLLVAPFWVSYSAIVTLAEGNPIEIRSDISSDFKITASQLDNSITPNTKLVIISVPRVINVDFLPNILSMVVIDVVLVAGPTIKNTSAAPMVAPLEIIARAIGIDAVAHT